MTVRYPFSGRFVLRDSLLGSLRDRVENGITQIRIVGGGAERRFLPSNLYINLLFMDDFLEGQFTLAWPSLTLQLQ